MNKIMKDVEEACNIVDGNSYSNEYGRIYCFSNEDLKALFDSVSVKDKDVLTVLSSGDQYFYSYYNGARSVDVFDRNKLTKYYYYLRKWGIKYLGKFSLGSDFIKHTKYINELLELVTFSSESEEEAYSFWYNYIRKVFPFDNSNLFYLGSRNRNDMDRVDKLYKYIDNDLNFYNGNMKEYYPRNKKYDVIIMSNILEYCDDRDYYMLKSNLYNLLNEDGVVVCSKITNCCNIYTQIRSFSECFDYEELYNGYRNGFYGYTYTKNVNKK